jgi:regulator of sirC expression with transglutaminase-like and TPR domain
LNEALRTMPTENGLYQRAMVRLETGDPLGAISDFNQVTMINPKAFEATAQRGKARLQAGDEKGALLDFERALKINPRHQMTNEIRKMMGQLRNRKNVPVEEE